MVACLPPLPKDARELTVIERTDSSIVAKDKEVAALVQEENNATARSAYAHAKYAKHLSAVMISLSIFALSFVTSLREHTGALSGPARRLDDAIRTDTGQRAAAHQLPSQVWKYDNGLSDYQVWTAYRLATKHLHFYHAGRPTDNRCRALSACHAIPETSRHVFWDCQKARACWNKFLRHWTGAKATPPVLASCLGNCANRQAPIIPASQRALLLERFQDDAPAGEQVWRQIWFLMSSICITHLWCERNDAVFRGVQSTTSQSVEQIWTTGVRQLYALAMRERRGPATVLQVAR